AELGILLGAIISQQERAHLGVVVSLRLDRAERIGYWLAVFAGSLEFHQVAGHQGMVIDRGDRTERKLHRRAGRLLAVLTAPIVFCQEGRHQGMAVAGILRGHWAMQRRPPGFAWSAFTVIGR